MVHVVSVLLRSRVYGLALLGLDVEVPNVLGWLGMCAVGWVSSRLMSELPWC